jgi:iron complex transport system substrate-binding protein
MSCLDGVRNRGKRLKGVLFATAVLLLTGGVQAAETRQIQDAVGRTVSIPEKVERVICSGPGCLRLLTYIGGQDRIVAVDSLELGNAPVDARPYAIANPQFKKYPMFGELRGHDNPELIASLDPQPQVIFKTYANRGLDPDQLQAKTGIPVVVLEYGNLTYGRSQLDQALRLMGEVMGETERAEAVIAYFNTLQQDLDRRTRDVADKQRPSCYIGGLAQAGPHGFQSTEPSFAPFAFTHANNVAAALSSSGKYISHANVAKEQIVVWDPDVIFLDVSTLHLDRNANGLAQLRQDPAYQALKAVREGQVYGLFPYNAYTQNFEAIFANAYYVGKILYPERFADVEPMAKAEEICTFINGAPAFEVLNKRYDGMAFTRVPVRPS